MPPFDEHAGVVYTALWTVNVIVFDTVVFPVVLIVFVYVTRGNVVVATSTCMPVYSVTVAGFESTVRVDVTKLSS
jgi:hypothetical protein